MRNEIITIKSKNRGKAHSNAILERKILANHFQMNGNSEEELAIRQKIVALYRKNHAENPSGGYNYFEEIPDALKIVASLLDSLERTEELKKIRQDIVTEYEYSYAEIIKNFDEKSEDVIFILENFADALEKTGDYKRELEYRKKLDEILKSNDLYKNDLAENKNRIDELQSIFGVETD